MPTASQNKFYGGIADDVRQPLSTVVNYASHFDLWSNPYRATPFRTMSAADATAGSNIRNLFYASDGKMYGLGVNPSSTSFMRLFSSAHAAFTSWTTAATWSTNQANTQTFNVLIEYKDHLWGVAGTGLTKVWKYGPLSGSPSLTETVATISPSAGSAYTRSSNAVIGSDDNLYFVLSAPDTPVVDVIKVNAAGSVSIAAYAPPSDARCTCLSKYGSYLALGFVRPSEFSITNSRSFIKLWDYVSPDSANTINSTDGGLVAMGEVDGELITVSLLFRTAFGTASNTIIGVVRGNETQMIKTLYSVSPTSSRMQVYSGGLYFAGTHVSNYLQTGIYVIGRPSANYNWAVNQEYQAVASGDTTNPSAVTSFHVVDDYMWISHSTDNVTKIFNSATYLNSSTIETTINPGMKEEHRGRVTAMKAYKISFVPLGSGIITVAYKVDGSAYTNIFSHTTSSSEAAFEQGFDVNGSIFASGREYQFKITSTGGVEFTGFDFRYELTTQDLV